MIFDNLDMEFHYGYIAGLEEVLRRLTESSSGRTEAYEDTVAWIESELGR